MEKYRKIILSCACVAFVLLGFGIGRIADTAPAAGSNQTINVNDTESEARDSSSKNNIAYVEGEGDSIRIIITQDGKEWTINADPSVLGNNFDWYNFEQDNYDIKITGDHEL